jgi:SAM-dependent methyltransferase
MSTRQCVDIPMLFQFANNRDPASYASKLRLQRNQWFASLIADLPRPLSILDVGGTEKVWETVGLAGDPTVRVTLVNVEPVLTMHSNIQSVLADARDLRQFADSHFDVVYSNSVIEHVGRFNNMKRMADEVRRVGKRYFVQTPNRYFPMEPHFLFPLFQFMPRAVRVSLVRFLHLSWIDRQPTWNAAWEAVDSINLEHSKKPLPDDPSLPVIDRLFCDRQLS